MVHLASELLVIKYHSFIIMAQKVFCEFKVTFGHEILISPVNICLVI